MAEPKPYAVVLVPSLSHAMKAETVLEQAGITNKLIPVPRHLSSQCGVCVRILRDDQDRVRALLEDATVKIVGIHET